MNPSRLPPRSSPTSSARPYTARSLVFTSVGQAVSLAYGASPTRAAIEAAVAASEAEAQARAETIPNARLNVEASSARARANEAIGALRLPAEALIRLLAAVQATLEARAARNRATFTLPTDPAFNVNLTLAIEAEKRAAASIAAAEAGPAATPASEFPVGDAASPGASEFPVGGAASEFPVGGGSTATAPPARNYLVPAIVVGTVLLAGAYLLTRPQVSSSTTRTSTRRAGRR